jgi:hypothetical protein
MTYGVIVRVAAPVEMYDAMHAEVLRSTGASVDGLLLHIGRSTGDGFEVIEVWTDKGQFDRYNREVVWPATARLAEGQAGPPPSMQTEEFDVRGLVIPAAHLAQ